MPKQPVEIPEHLRKYVKEEPFRMPPWIWLAAAVVLVPLVYFIQQFTLNLRGQTYVSVPREVAEREEPEDPGVSEFTVSAKLMVKMSHLLERFDQKDEEGEFKPEKLDAMAVTRVDKLRVAIVAGEVKGPEEAVKRLDQLAAEAQAGGEMAHEVVWLKKLYAEGPESLPDDAKRSLVDRHGWFGELALSRGRPAGDVTRARLVGGALKVGGIMLAIGLGAILSFIAGVILLLIALRQKAEGALVSGIAETSTEPVYLETFVVFAGAFLFVLLMTLLMFGMHAEASAGAMVFQEFLLWMLVGVLAWPMIRKVPWVRVSQELGLHAGQGVVREAMCGVAGWLVSVPVSVGVSKIIGLFSAESPESEGPQGYPLFEPPQGASWGLLWMGVLSAVLWAPVVEEFVFRGALYAYLRPRLRWLGAAVVTSALFGFVHPYTTAGLVSVGISGMIFALLREWRGSLIAPMVCHFLHNATIMLVTVSIIGALE